MSSDLSPLFTTRDGTAVPWAQRVAWILIRQTYGISLILVRPFSNFIYLRQLTRTMVIIFQGTLAMGEEPPHPKATALTEVFSVYRRLLPPSTHLPQVGCCLEILTASVNSHSPKEPLDRSRDRARQNHVEMLGDERGTSFPHSHFVYQCSVEH